MDGEKLEQAPQRNHPLLLLSGVGTNAIGYDLSPEVTVTFFDFYMVNHCQYAMPVIFCFVSVILGCKTCQNTVLTTSYLHESLELCGGVVLIFLVYIEVSLSLYDGR